MGIRQSHTPIDPDSDECPPYDYFPTVEEFNLGLGGYATALYCYSAIAIAVLALQFGFLSGHFLTNVPSCRQVATFWVSSVYLVIAVFSNTYFMNVCAITSMVSIVLPASSTFVWLFYQIYVSMAMGQFVFLTVSWYGGESAMLERIGEGVEISFRVRPCCCIFCCPKAAPFSKNKIRFMKLAVYQMPYVQGTLLFLMAVLNVSGYLVPGDMSPARPYLYLSLGLTFSFLAGIWGLFMFMAITKQYSLLVHYNYRKKSTLLKLMVVCVNVQGIVIDILTRYGVVHCMAPYISSSAMGAVIKSMLSLSESLILGILCYLLYITDTRYL